VLFTLVTVEFVLAAYTGWWAMLPVPASVLFFACLAVIRIATLPSF
jgi:hypothetical protein